MVCLALAVMFMAQFVVRAELSLVQKSPVWDEQLHLRYGLDLLAEGPGDHGRDHAYPVAALLAAAVRGGEEGPRSGRELRVEEPSHLWPARRVNVALAAIALILLFGLAWRHFDARHGVAVLGLGTLDPAWIAQARFATTDIALGLAFGLAAFGVVWVRRSSRPWAVVTLGLVTGLGLTAKVSALLIPVFVPLAYLIPLGDEGFTERLGRRLARGLVHGAAVAAVGLVLYLAVIEMFALWHGVELAQGWSHVTEGFVQSLSKRSEPRGVYLLGTFHGSASFLYFPVLLLAKTPVTLWALLGLTAATRQGRAFVVRHRLLFLVPGGFGLVAILSRVNLGYRHLTPVLPALWILGAAGLLVVWRWTRRGPLYSGALVLALVVESVMPHPHYLPATNIFFGGVDGAYRVAVDSATDWGQDLPALRDYLKRHPPGPGAGPVHLAYFGNADPRAFLGKVVWRPCGKVGAPLRFGQPAAGCRVGAQVLAISATCYVGATGRRVGRTWRLDEQSRCWKWLRNKKPHAILGGSILVFRNVAP